MSKNTGKIAFPFMLKKEAYFFIDNLAILLSSGMGVSSAVQSIIEETDSKRMKKLLSGVLHDLEEGNSLHTCLERSGVFSQRILSLVEVGEKSGRLRENLEVGVLQNEKEALFKTKIRSSLAYAVIIITLSLIVGMGTVWFTLPKLTGFFTEANVQLPLITRWLIIFGEILHTYGIFIFSFFSIFIVIAFYFLFSFPKTRFIGHLLLFRLPLIRSLIKDSEISRFGYLFGTMLDSGMSLVESIDAMKKTTTLRNYQKFYEYLSQEVQKGNSLQKSFDNYPKTKKLYPSQVRQLLAAAEKSGTLSETLKRIGKNFEERTEVSAKSLPTILEPLLIIFVGIVVALIAVGIILPIYNLPDLV